MEFFKDASGQLSAMRLVFILWSLGLLAAVLISLAINRFDLSKTHFDPSLVSMYALTLGSKIVQKFSEPHPDQPDPAAPSETAAPSGVGA